MSSTLRWYGFSLYKVTTWTNAPQNLGLGVLKMKDGDHSSTSGSDTEMSDDEDMTKEKDVLGKLMGQEKKKEVAAIQEVNDKQGS